jgi:DNA-binding transcriptional LysR family regulator
MDLERLDLKKLRAFQLVSTHGSLRLAALRLKQTVPAVSAKIRRLETELGVALFERLPNKLILTEAGQTFLGEVEAIFERAEQALTVLAAPAVLSGRITVSVGSDSSWYIAPRISRFLKRYPGAELDLRVLSGPDAIRALLRGDLDVSIGVFASVPKTLDMVVMTETAMSLVCPHGHPLLQQRIPRLPEIARHRLIVHQRQGATRKLVDKVMSRHSATPGSVIEVANCQTAVTFVESGVGVAIVHSLCVEHVGSDRVSAIELGRLFGKLPFRAVFRRGTRSPLVRALLAELKP